MKAFNINHIQSKLKSYNINQHKIQREFNNKNLNTCDFIYNNYIIIHPHMKICNITIPFFIILLLSTHFARAEEHYEFVAEVGRLMDILINSLYTQKQIFLREVISNASDALDKIRFEAISDPSVLGTSTQLEIKVEFDDVEKSLTVVDNGIGMTKNDLIQNLGTVAKSGTSNFLEAIKGGNLNLIGQFGVGFYSTFLAGSKVEVISKHNSDRVWKWESSAANSFTIIEDDYTPLQRGTIVKIYLKEDAYEFCEYSTLENLIKRYSSFINFPIYLKNVVQISEKQDKTQAEIDKEKEELIQKKKAAMEEIDEQEIQNSITRTKTITKPSTKWERMNNNKALWLRDRREVETKQYKDFYKAVFKDQNEPSVWSHFKAEGQIQFSALLFIPERAPYDLLEKFYQKKAQLKLYVRRVLINDEFQDLLPKYLNFLKGIVDSDELPLNVNRQNLQQEKMLSVIGNKLLKKSIDMLVSFNPQIDDEDELQESTQEEEDQQDSSKSKYQRRVEKFNKFWKNYGKNIKLGMIQDNQNRDKLAPLSRWYTTHNVSELTSLDEYISRIPEGDSKKYIYYLGGEDRNIIKDSPLIQKLINDGYEVILGDDPLDETVFNTYKQYKDIKIINVARNDFKDPTKNDDSRRKAKSLTKTFQPLIDYAGQELKNFIKSVKISERLTTSPVVIVSDMMNDTPNRERLELGSAMKSSMSFHQEKNILQINPYHPLIQELNKRIEDDPDEHSAHLIKTLYSAATVHTGFVMKNPLEFSKSIFSLINTALEITPQNQVQEIEVTDEQLESMDAKPEEPTPSQPEIKAQAETSVNLDETPQVIELDSQEGNSQL